MDASRYVSPAPNLKQSIEHLISGCVGIIPGVTRVWFGQVHPDFRFESKTYYDMQYHFRSIETWLQGTCTSHLAHLHIASKSSLTSTGFSVGFDRLHPGSQQSAIKTLAAKPADSTQGWHGAAPQPMTLLLATRRPEPLHAAPVAPRLTPDTMAPTRAELTAVAPIPATRCSPFLCSACFAVKERSQTMSWP
eukprot:2757199-Rhodomonas_salina.1